MIMTGKRTTKRPRPSVTSSSSGASIGGGGGGGGEGVVEEFNSVSSPTTSSGLIYESTGEEEDMANCLIMLAQSGGPKRKFSSRKFSEISTTTTNKAGFFVYECKTCNRSFPSFQALGGHRAGHKKPKGGSAAATDTAVDQEHHLGSPILASQVSNNNSNNKGNKIHECSICGSEFSSGQALGGHMRRHRAAAAAVVAAATSTTGRSKQAGVVSRVDTHTSTEIKPRNVLSLDLNLPAPEDDLRDSEFQFVFSTPALVDCHY